MNSFELTVLEEATGRDWTAASAEMMLEHGLAAAGIQAIQLSEDNKINAIVALNKYFLTNSNEQFGAHERCEQKAWRH